MGSCLAISPITATRYDRLRICKKRQGRGGGGQVLGGKKRTSMLRCAEGEGGGEGEGGCRAISPIVATRYDRLRIWERGMRGGEVKVRAVGGQPCVQACGISPLASREPSPGIVPMRAQPCARLRRCAGTYYTPTLRCADRVGEEGRWGGGEVWGGSRHVLRAPPSFRA